MNVTLPDGRVIRNVPPGITQEELIERLAILQEQRGEVTPETPAPIVRPTGQISAKAIEERQQQPFPGQAVTEKSPVLESEAVQGVKQVVKESALPMAGTALGIGAGSLTGPAAPALVPSLAMIGGGLGEKLNQVLGITPPSEQAQGLAAIAPVIGPLGAKTIQKTLGRGIGKVSEKIPIVEVARANAQMREAVPQLESVGGSIIANRRGIQAVPAKRLYEAAEKSGVSVPVSVFGQTRRAMDDLVDNLEDLKTFPEVNAALEHVQRMTRAFEAGGDPIGFAQLVGMRQQLGGIVRQVEKATGVRLGAAKLLFKSFENDLGMLRRSRGAARVPARVLKRASERAKLDFAIADFEDAVARFTTVNADNVSINVNGLRNWLRDATNPKHGSFDRNFTDALGRDLPGINKQLETLDKITQKFGTSPAGKGSIVIRGIGATSGRAVVGALFGYGASSAAGLPPALSAIGGLIGASMPEIMVAALSSPKTLNIMNRLAATGKGQIDVKKWALLSQAAMQAAMPRDRTAETVRSVKGTPAEK